jgi:tetratricopeptide (TPR) repeat protein
LAFANRDWTRADSAFRRAIALDPTYAPARYWYGQLLALVGAKDEGLAQAREAVNLDPLSAVAHFNLSAIANSMRRYVDARTAAERAVELQPTYAFPYWGLAAEYARNGERQRAEAAMRRLIALTSSDAKVDDTLISDYVGALSTRRDTTRSVVRLLQTHAIRGNSFAAWSFALAGERDSAFSRLRQAIAIRSLQAAVGVGNAEPLLESDPRWAVLMKDMGLKR